MIAGGQAGEVFCIFQNAEMTREKLRLKVSGEEGPGKMMSLTNWQRRRV